MIGKLWPHLVQWLLVLTLPVCLIVASVRVTTGHWFVHWEYGKADFPPDHYGLSMPERTRLIEACVDYLATNADITLLSDLRLPGGEPAFNERELRHMVDVQVVFSRMMLVGAAAALVQVGGIAALLRSSRTRWRAPAALLGGSLLTLGLLGVVGAYMLLNWGEFFTTFHRIFFEGESWLFAYSDTLIRLCPMPLWVDAAIVIVSLLVAGAIAVGIAGWVWRRRLGRAGQRLVRNCDAPRVAAL
jgi:integral membrane protein (TIGR01906 family)